MVANEHAPALGSLLVVDPSTTSGHTRRSAARYRYVRRTAGRSQTGTAGSTILPHFFGRWTNRLASDHVKIGRIAEYVLHQPVFQRVKTNDGTSSAVRQTTWQQCQQTELARTIPR